MSGTKFAERSDSTEEQVSGATLIAQALQTQVRSTRAEGKAPTEAGGDQDVLKTEDAECGGIGRVGGSPEVFPCSAPGVGGILQL